MSSLEFDSARYPVVFQAKHVIEGVKVRVRDVRGYQVGALVAVYPSLGLYEGHLFAWDPSVDSTIGVIPEVVTRLFAECVVLCDTPELVEEYAARLRGAPRTYVVLEAEERQRWQAWLDEHMSKSGDKPGPHPLRPSAEELAFVTAANESFTSPYRTRAYERLLKPFRPEPTTSIKVP